MAKLKAVIFDWAGTIVDHGSLAPMGAFLRAFAAMGVAITTEDARGPMGMAKRDHIRMVGETPSVAAAWRARHGRDFNDTDIEAIFKIFEPLNIESVRDHSALIPGAAEAIADARSRGLRIGSTTGYTRPIMAALLPIAAEAGYRPEITICAGDLPAGRPSPLMLWYAMAKLGVWPAANVVKVDDTEPGIGEGAAAGTWTIGVARTGNIAGLTAAELAGLPAPERDSLRARASGILYEAGADIVIDSVADLPAALDRIEAALASGATPGSFGRHK